MKKCRVCQETKPLDEFDYRKDRGNWATWCKPCRRKHIQTQYYTHPEKSKNYYFKNRDKILAYKKKYFSDPDVRTRTWKVRSKRRKYRMTIDINYKVSQMIRQLIRCVFSRYESTKKNTTVKYLGCDFVFYKNYLESLFEPGMTWENYGNKKGRWCVGHIIPIRSFDISNDCEALKAFNYHNAKPQWVIENIRDCDRFPDGSLGRDNQIGAMLFDYLMTTQNPETMQPLILNEMIFDTFKQLSLPLAA